MPKAHTAFVPPPPPPAPPRFCWIRRLRNFKLPTIKIVLPEFYKPIITLPRLPRPNLWPLWHVVRFCAWAAIPVVIVPQLVWWGEHMKLDPPSRPDVSADDSDVDLPQLPTLKLVDMDEGEHEPYQCGVMTREERHAAMEHRQRLMLNDMETNLQQEYKLSNLWDPDSAFGSEEADKRYSVNPAPPARRRVLAHPDFGSDWKEPPPDGLW